MAAPPFRLRPAVLNDLPALTLLSAMNRVFHAQIDPSTEGPNRLQFCRERYSRLLQADNAVVLIAEAEDGAPVACLGAIFRPPSGNRPKLVYIEDVFVVRSWRRRGVLSEMMAALLKRCEQQGIETIEVDYLADNPSSSAAWQRLGFRPRMVEATSTVTTIREHLKRSS